LVIADTSLGFAPRDARAEEGKASISANASEQLSPLITSLLASPLLVEIE
jgi:hypothetical protein